MAAKYPTDEISGSATLWLRNVLAAKCPSGEMFIGEISAGRISGGETTTGEKYFQPVCLP